MVPPRATLNIPNTKVKEIFVELKTLKLDTYPHAISVLFRVFFELSVDLFLDSAGISLFIDAGGGKKKHKLFERKINEAVDHFEKSGVERRDIRGVSTMSSDPQNPLHPDFLHAYVHQANFSPRENDLRTAWDNAAPFFERIWP